MKEYIVKYETEQIENSTFFYGGKIKHELIRCKDCAYFTPEKSGEHWSICRFYDAPKTADGYCNDADPKDKP